MVGWKYNNKAYKLLSD